VASLPATHAFQCWAILPVARIDTPLIMKAVEPIWKTKTETASRVRRGSGGARFRNCRGYRKGENPARWKGPFGAFAPRTGEGPQGAAPYRPALR